MDKTSTLAPDIKNGFIPGYKFNSIQWRDRDISIVGATIIPGIENFIACSGAYPGAGLNTCPGKWLRIMQKV